MYDIAKKRALRHSHRTLRQRVKEPVKRQKVLILSGPTAAGKTSCSLSLAEKIGGEIISADSMQVYRGMDIGTAKVTLEERTRVRHHLIDIVDIKDPFNVMTFYNKAHDAIKDILSRDKVPIVVGGTGFRLDMCPKCVFGYLSLGLFSLTTPYCARVFSGRHLWGQVCIYVQWLIACLIVFIVLRFSACVNQRCCIASHS